MAKIILLGSHPESLVNFRKEMIQALAVNNQVIVCAPGASEKIIEQLKQMGVEYKNINLSRTGLNPFKDILTLISLYKLFIKTYPEQVFFYTGKPVIFGSIAAKLAGVKQIYSMITGLGSNFVYNDIKSLSVRLVMMVLYKIALLFNTKVFFQNQDDRAEFVRLRIFNDPRRTVMINGSGVNLDYFTLQETPEKVSFLMVGRFIRTKGVYEYLAAARLLKQQYPEVDFLLVGWQENKSETVDLDILQSYIDDKTIINLGKLSDVRPAIAQAGIFVLPSYREGMPRSVLEAMASGRAIITTDVPGCRETVVNNHNGFLIPARDILALRNAMEKFILQPELIVQMGQRSRDLVIEKYDVHKVNDIILNAMEIPNVALS